jgi:hypothetical protein
MKLLKTSLTPSQTNRSVQRSPHAPVPPSQDVLTAAQWTLTSVAAPSLPTHLYGQGNSFSGQRHEPDCVTYPLIPERTNLVNSNICTELQSLFHSTSYSPPSGIPALTRPDDHQFSVCCLSNFSPNPESSVNLTLALLPIQLTNNR